MLRNLLITLLLASLRPAMAEAQWVDPRLVAGQVGFHVAVSFAGKLVFDRREVGQAFREALREGAVAGVIAHAGNTMAGRNAHLTLPAKLLVQKSTMITRRSIHRQAVFDASLYSDWTLTHSFLHFRVEDLEPRVELDVANAAVATYYLFAGPQYHFDSTRTLYTGSLVFRNDAPPANVLGYHVPGVIWIDSAHQDDTSILSHEVIHSFQAERGASVADWHYRGLRFNPLAVLSGLPALLEGWPDHDHRLHEVEAIRYSGH